MIRRRSSTACICAGEDTTRPDPIQCAAPTVAPESLTHAQLAALVGKEGVPAIEEMFPLTDTGDIAVFSAPYPTAGTEPKGTFTRAEFTVALARMAVAAAVLATVCWGTYGQSSDG